MNIGDKISYLRKQKELSQTVGESNKKTFDKQTVKRMEEIEKLPEDTRKTVLNLIDMAIGYTKTKKAMAS